MGVRASCPVTECALSYSRAPRARPSSRPRHGRRSGLPRSAPAHPRRRLRALVDQRPPDEPQPRRHQGPRRRHRRPTAPRPARQALRQPRRADGRHGGHPRADPHDALRRRNADHGPRHRHDRPGRGPRRHPRLRPEVVARRAHPRLHGPRARRLTALRVGSQGRQPSAHQADAHARALHRLGLDRQGQGHRRRVPARRHEADARAARRRPLAAPPAQRREEDRPAHLPRPALHGLPGGASRPLRHGSARHRRVSAARSTRSASPCASRASTPARTAARSA